MEFDVILITAFGRERWLAMELSRQGLKVGILDVTSGLGRWAPEDVEGPFGIFQSRQNQATQMARLADEEPLVSTDEGWVIWPRTGPIELKGPLSKTQIESNGISNTTMDYIRISDTKQKNEIESIKRKVLKEPFEKNWLGGVAHQIASPIYMESHCAFEIGEPLPLLSPFYFRRLTRRGEAYSLEKLKELGVERSEAKSIFDIELESSKLKSILVDSETKFLGKDFIWLLSSVETQFVLGEDIEELFPKGPLKSQWYWTRFRVRIEQDQMTRNLPDYFVMLNDKYLPWTHENLALFQRTLVNEDFDFWLRLPTSCRFRSSYIKDCGEKVISELKSRLPGVSLSISDWPQEVTYSEEELGPPRFPIYEKNKHSQLQRAKLSNVVWDGPERWSMLNWGGQFRSNEKACQKILKLNDDRKIKSGEKISDQEVHPI